MLAATVVAQSTTEEGIRAVLRGDYDVAARILRPLAEDSVRPDPVAQFFLAGLYESGRGVPVDPLRACALYARASSNSGSPFELQAMTLFATSIARGPEFAEECQLLSIVGFDHGFEPVTFHLGAGHSVQWTLGTVTVTYQGQFRSEPTAFAQVGARFLPLQYTELATGPARNLTRHFVEAFLWQPSGKSGQWNLQWHAFEVVRDQIIRIDTPFPVLTVSADAPPPVQTFDIREYVSLRVDDNGNAEWAILKGPRAETRRIESDAERREIRETDLARADALARVDWNRRSEVDRQPGMTYVDADGCGHVQVYGWTADRSEALVVRAVIPDLEPATPVTTFDLARDLVNISVQAHVYDSPQPQFYFCSDVAMPRAPDSIEPEIWSAVAGTVSVELSPPGIRASHPGLRRATVTVSNVVLRNAAGTTLRVSRPVKLSAIVGWMGW